MSDTIIFRGALIRKVTKHNSDTDKGVRIEIAADWTDKVREAMSWGEVPDGHGKSDLFGELAAGHIILTPSAKELKQHELQIDISECGGFSQVPVKDGDGNVGTRELRFTIKSSAEDACARAEGYVNVMGQAKGQLRVSYVKQEPLEFGAAEGGGQEPLENFAQGEEDRKSVV